MRIIVIIGDYFPDQIWPKTNWKWQSIILRIYIYIYIYIYIFFSHNSSAPVIAEAVTYTTHNKTQETNIHALAGFETAIPEIKRLQDYALGNGLCDHRFRGVVRKFSFCLPSLSLGLNYFRPSVLLGRFQMSEFMFGGWAEMEVVLFMSV